MKKIKLGLGIILIGLLGAGTFTSCEEDETTEPTIDISESSVPDSVEAGVEVTLKFSVITSEKLDKIELRKGTETLDTKSDGFTDKSADQYSYTGVVADTAEAESTLDMALIVTDNDDNEKTHDFSLYVKAIDTIALTTYDQKVMGVALGDGSSEDLLSIESGETYTYDYVDINGIKDSADILCGYTDLKTFKYQLVSPANSPDYIHDGGTLPNTTYYNKVTDVTFDEVTADGIAENVSDFNNEFVDIAENDVVAFITEAGHKGYIKVVSIDKGSNGEAGDADDEVTFDIKAVLASELSE
ncbi:MAG: hypothetical protein K9H65_02470 [Bacteroidales bacterium]|nr:hypothetical protein [Bacteroidales bacterium]